MRYRERCGRARQFVLLCEKDTSLKLLSASKNYSWLLRYLEDYQFRLVREALIEREIYYVQCHIVATDFVATPRRIATCLAVKARLFLYDHLGGREILPPVEVLNLRSHPAGAPLKDMYQQGFEYSDCWLKTQDWLH